MPGDHRDGAMAERVHERDRVAHHVENPERIGIGVVRAVPAGRASVAALVGGDHVVARRRERQHHLAPAVRELWKAVQQEDRGTPRPFESGLEDIHGEAVHVRDRARANAGRNRAVAVRPRENSRLR